MRLTFFLFLFLLLLLILSSNFHYAFATPKKISNVFVFDDKRKIALANFSYATLNVDYNEYHTGVAPKLKVIISEFINALKVVHPFPTEVIKNLQHVVTLDRLLNQWRLNCYLKPRDKLANKVESRFVELENYNIYEVYSCEELLEKFYVKLREIEFIMFDLQSKAIDLISKVNMINVINIDGRANGNANGKGNFLSTHNSNRKNFENLNAYIKMSDDINETLMKILKWSNIILHDQRLLAQNQKHLLAVNISDFERDVWEMNLIAERLVFNGLPYLNGFDVDFLLVWNSFVRILYRDILPLDNYALFARRIEDLNLYWNMFYKKMSREGKNIPGDLMVPLASINDQMIAILRILVDKKTNSKF
ncbi:MAG: hypothetical protein HQK49_10885 [Oligoflexia bacterium]|nr:hypothetical protein [Oligoflexia bacterium]